MQYFKQVSFFVAIVASSILSGQLAADELDEFVGKSRQMMQSAQEEIPESLTSAEPDQDAIDQAATLLTGHKIPYLSGKGVEKQQHVKQQNTSWDDDTPALYVSLSMPGPLLKTLLQDAKERSYPVVFRGIMPDAKLNSIAIELTKLTGNAEDLPTVLLDSLAFKKYGVHSVPTFVVPRKKLGLQPIVYSGGTPSNDWITENIGNEFDGPVRSADTYSIAEPDFIEEMSRRFATIDWEKKKQEAIDRFWSVQSKSFARLPEVKETGSFKFNPAIVVTKLVQTPDGKVIARPGDIVNPLKALRLSQTYMFFNATKQTQITFVKEYLRTHPNANIKLIATEVPATNGWDAFEKIESSLGARLYLAPQILVERFRLRAVPCVVTSEGTSILVNEFYPG